MSVHFFGIRHHGPGCARALEHSLAALQPDCVLIEGPPEGDGLLQVAARPELKPPVALLIYPPEAPRLGVFYPFADFSPEWRAIRYAVECGVPASFMDLPQTHHFAERLAEEAAAQEQAAGSENEPAAATAANAGVPEPASPHSTLWPPSPVRPASTTRSNGGSSRWNTAATALICSRRSITP